MTLLLWLCTETPSEPSRRWKQEARLSGERQNSQMKITWGNHRMLRFVSLVVLRVLMATTGAVLKVFEETTQSPKVSTGFHNCRIPDAKLGSVPIAPISQY